MDGRKRWVRNSLQFRLSFGLSLAILTIAIIAGIFAFFAAFSEANELQDDVLRQIATLFDKQRFPLPENGIAGTDLGEDTESQVFVQVLPTTALVSAKKNDELLGLPQGLSDGMNTVNMSGKTYRVFVTPLGTEERLAVAQDTEVRDEIARDSALRTLMPFLILVPVLLLVVAGLVRTLFKPVAALSLDIDRRGDRELYPIDSAPLPIEIQPFVAAINRLLARIEQEMAAQQRFIADAAHELRSPMTALSLQVERLAASEMSASAQERLDLLRQGIDRNRALLSQLLTLARVQASGPLFNEPISILYVYRQVLEDLMPLADAKGIDIGVVSDRDIHIVADAVDLATLVKNLVDNAIRYTPKGGRIDLCALASGGAAVLIITDNGPGVPKSEWTRVFDPFYRIVGSGEVGSGLGLSIVKAISQRMGASVAFDFTDPQAETGLTATVIIPDVMPNIMR
ncbi:sensor histidine kinase [Limnobaculum parvum]|uniref:histidine kinase n=1 Tax=Limnobaculum parvum TaxID=2172103 RepID=A0A2Y9TYK3_9GAMM|nr:ATP-binding protein [Limnobaculum parvum]AWH88611.1 two-component sensor histidine kinase [Limnobaculum parvum]